MVAMNDSLRAMSTLDAADPHPQAHPQLGVDPRRAVGSARVGMDLHDQPGQFAILEFTRGWLALDRLVADRSGDLEDPAGHRDREPVRGQFLGRPDRCFVGGRSPTRIGPTRA